MFSIQWGSVAVSESEPELTVSVSLKLPGVAGENRRVMTQFDPGPTADGQPLS